MPYYKVCLNMFIVPVISADGAYCEKNIELPVATVFNG
jgi:hypothetical protein